MPQENTTTKQPTENPFEDADPLDLPKRCADAVLHHGEASGPEYMVGDVQDLVAAALNVMTPTQRKAWFMDHRVQNVFQCGEPGDREGLPVEEP